MVYLHQPNMLTWQKCTTQIHLSVGTCMAIGGDKEATAIDKADSDICIGVISTKSHI